MGEEADSLEPLRKEFANAIHDTVRECRKLGYNPTAFQVMVHEHGATEAVRRLLQPPVEQPSDGFTRLWEMGWLDLAVENLARFESRFEGLFTQEERALACQRLALYNFRRAG